MYERLWCVSVSKILFSNFWPVTTPCKGEAGTLVVATKSWYIKKIMDEKIFSSYCCSLMTIFATDQFKRGMYAVSVSGRLPPTIIRDMKSRGIKYRSRDTATKT